jgi:hypothetical protein
MKKRTLYAVGTALVIAVAILLVWWRRTPAPIESSHGGWLQPVPPMGDAMPILRPGHGVDTGMPVMHLDSTGRAHLPQKSRPSGAR